MTRSALYVGHVSHRRHRPRSHALRYRCYWLLADLDELPDLSQQLRLLSHNRWNIFSLRDCDHGDRSGRNLKGYVNDQLHAAGLPPASIIRLLTMPRILGYAFNPISIYYCHAPNGDLTALLYEVRNTFGQHHSYLIPVETPATGPIVQHCRKAFYVSPFLDMDLDYEFHVAMPSRTIGVAIEVADSGAAVLTAALSGMQRPLTDRTLAWLLVSQPLLTLKVIAAIHYEALLLILKGIGLKPRPAPPLSSVSLQARDHAASSSHV
jgi:uncharacterized protein